MTSESASSKKSDGKERPVIAKTPADLQRIRLEKLMKNPDKPVIIPPRPKEKNSPHVPEFVRNVMGSSAGAGSGEFHVYRHLRRKEYARQKFIQEKAGKESLEEEYHQKIEENRRKAEEATAKKRAKRLKKNKNRKKRKFNTPGKGNSEQKSSEDEDSDEDSTGEKEVQSDSVNTSSTLEEESNKIENSAVEEKSIKTETENSAVKEKSTKTEIENSAVEENT